MLKRKTVQIGDVFRILTCKGVCYGQVTHTIPEFQRPMLHLVAVFREFFFDEPTDFESVVATEPQFIAVFNIKRGVRWRFFALVANVPIAKHLQEFPIFRSSAGAPMLWDGEKAWLLKRPYTREEMKYPVGPQFISYPLFIKWIEENWRAEIDAIPHHMRRRKWYKP